MAADVIANFENPPLDEVVVGIQFERPFNFNATHIGDIWNLFRSEFPKVSEHPRLPPQFEVYGNPGIPMLQLNFVQGLPNRIWFAAEDDSHLLQFQDDRLLMNWRRQKLGAPYPRHPALIEKYRQYITKLNDYFVTTFSQSIQPTQAEVSYINLIPLDDLKLAGQWINIINTSILDTEQISSLFSEVRRSESGAYFGRLTGEIQSGLTREMTPAIRLSLTYRGKPENSELETALSFITSGRNVIVDRFMKITTAEAQQIWGKA